MNWKRILSSVLCALILLTATACGGNKSPSGGSSEGKKDKNNGFFAGIIDDILGNKPDDAPSLSGKSDNELITLFLAKYEEALNAPAYFKEYNFSTTFDSNTVANSIGYFMVNGKDFSVDWVDYVEDKNSALSVYKDGVLYVTKDGEESQKTVEKEAVRGELESLGTVYREIPRSDFASQTLTRNEDGSFLLNVTLSNAALQEISSDVLKASAEISGTRTFQGASLTLVFTKDGSLLRSRLIADVNVTAEDGTIQIYSVEKYLKYTSFDASKIVISAPEQTPDWEDSGETSDGFFTTDSVGSEGSGKASDTTDAD